MRAYRGARIKAPHWGADIPIDNDRKVEGILAVGVAVMRLLTK